MNFNYPSDSAVSEIWLELLSKGLNEGLLVTESRTRKLVAPQSVECPYLAMK
jgi:hypothetical protein